ncbi:MAG: hypothetical protein AMXMBFR84_24240 [Candidatus Hydrogenedentota bacterium]
MATGAASETLNKPPQDGEPAMAAGIPRYLILSAALFLLLVVLYWNAAQSLYVNWKLVDSYYSHGFFVPIISFFFVWRERKKISAIPSTPSPSGIVWIAGASILLLLGDFLGFTVLGHLSILPMTAGVCIASMGKARTRVLWFPITFLFFMIPIPPSLTQSVALKLKLIAASSAVDLANLLTLPMVQEGSYIHFRDDFLLVGEVCGGLRSLIALLALGALVAYISPVRWWARIALLLMAGPIAVAANIVRIFFLCVVGYFYGSEVAAGKVHDYSGILIFAVAMTLFFMLEVPLRRWAAAKDTAAASSDSTGPDVATPSVRPVLVAGATMTLVATIHLALVLSHAQAAKAAPEQNTLNLPNQIVDYKQLGSDIEIDEYTKALLETSTILIRNYTSPRGRPVQLTVVHAGTTRRSLHFPEVCLVGDGWEIREQELVPIGLSFNARRLVLVKGESTEAVLYWFKTGDVMTGNFFMNAAYWAKNQILMGSRSSSMIKLTTVIGPDGEEAAFSALSDFGAKVAPVVRNALP